MADLVAKLDKIYHDAPRHVVSSSYTEGWHDAIERAIDAVESDADSQRQMARDIAAAIEVEYQKRITRWAGVYDAFQNGILYGLDLAQRISVREAHKHGTEG